MLIRASVALLVLVVGRHAGAQTEKSAVPATAAKPVDVTVCGRKASLSPAEGWTAYKPEAAPELARDAAPWKLAGAWKSGKYDELTLRVYGVEKAGATAAGVRDAWLARATSNATPGFVVKTVVSGSKDKSPSGHDLEVDLKKREGKSYVWIRTLDLAKDKVAVLFCEANPLKPPEHNPFDQETFVREPHVLEIQPMLASFLKTAAKPGDVWVRGPAFEIARGEARLTVDAPKGWEYTRLSPEGSVIWMAPGDSGREYIVSLSECDGFAKLQIERMLLEASGGKLYEQSELGSGSHQIISAMKLGDRTLWNHRRVYQRGAISISVLAKVPIDDVANPPSAEIRKEAKAFQDTVRLGN